MLASKYRKGFVAVFAAIYISAAFTTAYGATVKLNLEYDGVVHKYSAEEIKITVNGNYITEFNVPPVSIGDRTLVPARAVFENLGADVQWNNATKEIFIAKDNDLVVLKVNSKVASKNGVNFNMDVPAKIINDSTMIPIRQVAEALDCTVGWDEKTRVVSINEKTIEPEEDPPVVGDDLPTVDEPVVDKPVIDTPVVEKPIEKPVTPSVKEITVKSVTVPDLQNSNQSFLINANNEITKYEVTPIANDRLAIDIYNANMGITNTNMTVANNGNVSSIRSAQFQVTPVKITRVVFDLKSSSKYNAELSSDKKSVIVTFEENNIKSLSFRNESGVDYIDIKGDTTPTATISKLLNPERIVIDIPNSDSQLKESYETRGAQHISDVRTSQFEKNTTRIVLNVVESVEYSIKYSSNSAVIQIYKSTMENVKYDSSSRLLTLAKKGDLNINQIKHTDNYLNKKYTLTLPGDYSSVYGFGTNNVKDSYLNSYTIGTNGNNTIITFDEAQILAYSITEDSNNIYIKVQLPKEKHNKIVVLDAGHGSTDPGTNGNGLVEKNVNLDILLKVYSLLEADPNIKVYATRITDAYPTNPDRAAMGNKLGDLFVSIHQNSASPNSVPNGTEVLYTPHGNEVNGKLTSKIAAQTMQKYILNAVGTTDRGIKNREDLIVLNQSKIPAILIECAFLSNEADAAKMASEEYKIKYAEAIYSAIVDMMNQYPVR